MALNPRVQQIIEQAKLRNQQLREAAANKAALPSSADVQKAQEQSAQSQQEESHIITVGGRQVDLFYIEGVGKLNKEQSEAVRRFGINGESGCLIGPAGTGKTTTMKAVIRAMILSGRVPILPHEAKHKYLQTGLPGIFSGSFTRIATRNLRDNCPDDIKGNVHTIHRLLEYEPEFKEVIDPQTQKVRNVRYFVPTRTPYRPLPRQLVVFNIDESSMVGYSNLYRKLEAAVGCDKPQFMFIGDIAQLPPVMDDAVLGYKMLELPVVELTQVYRHAGAIVNLANHIRVGNTIPAGKAVAPYSANLRKLPRKLVEDAINEWNKEEDGSKVTIHLWKTRLEGEVGQLRALQNLNNFFKKEFEDKRYDPMHHMILMPYNKAVGTIELNKFIAEFLGKQRNAEVHEVIAGFQKHYFAVGDKVFFEREEAIITKINRNDMYSGKLPQLPSVTLDRWGHDSVNKKHSDSEEFDSIDKLLNISVDEDEERKNAASHVIYVRKIVDIEDNEKGEEEDDEAGHRIDSAAEVNNLIFGYALTIHKSQGSQWQKVYCIFHNSHNRNLQRELLYTAITRAQKELYVIAEPETFIQGVVSQHIVGNSLAEKAEYFKGKIANNKKGDLLNGNGNGNGDGN